MSNQPSRFQKLQTVIAVGTQLRLPKDSQSANRLFLAFVTTLWTRYLPRPAGFLLQYIHNGWSFLCTSLAGSVWGTAGVKKMKWGKNRPVNWQPRVVDTVRAGGGRRIYWPRCAIISSGRWRSLRSLSDEEKTDVALGTKVCHDPLKNLGCECAFAKSDNW